MPNIKIYNTDCIEMMQKLIKRGVKVDAIITDPPFGTTKNKWDNVIPFDEMWECLKSLRKENAPIVLFGTEPFSSHLRLSNMKEYKYDWIWNKILKTGHLNAKKVPMGQHEIISVFGKGRVTYYPIMEEGRPQHSEGQGKRTHSKNYGKQKKGKDDSRAGNTLKYPSTLSLNFQKVHPSKCIHPTQKPIALLEYLIKTYTEEGDTVLDFTAGSGTTGCACRNLNRNFIGIEKDEGYFQIMYNRIFN